MNSSQPASKWLVSTEWLAARLGKPDLAVLDGSWYLPTSMRDGYGEYLAGHIPGAVFFDIDEIADQATDLPHMLPSEVQFAQDVGRLGVRNSDTVVAYDGGGLFSAPRVWWMFRVFGHDNVFVLDGGLPKWKAKGRPLETGEAKRAPCTFQAKFRPQLVASFDDVRAALANGTAQVVDARSAERFRGEAPEPRPGLRSGHMPGARNVPASLLTPQGQLAPHAQIIEIFTKAGVDLQKPIITSCGSGVSAAILWLALDAIGVQPQSLYDGSWTEWASRSDAPVATK